MDNESIFTLLEHAIAHVTRVADCDADCAAIVTLNEAWLAVGPLGQIPSWEKQ